MTDGGRRGERSVGHSDPPAAHRGFAGTEPVACAVITVSDTRTPETDGGGDTIVSHLRDAGHVVVARTIVADEPALVRDLITGDFAADASAILTTGGTGIAGRDTTFEAIAGLLEKTLPGFGEIFRMLSFQEVGAAAMLSRAIAGTHRGRIVFAMPGSPNAVRLAMERLVVPELRHLTWELGRHSG